MAQFNETGATTLPYTVVGSYGKFYGKHQSINYVNNYYDVSGIFKVRLYSTSSAVKSVDNTWVQLSEKSITANYNINGYTSFYMEFYNERFNGSNSFAIQVSTPTGSYVRTSIWPQWLYYSTVVTTIVDSGNAMGSYFYFVTDGGVVG